MGKIRNRIMILGGIFLLAVLAFLWIDGENKDEEISYDVMESASLPVITLEVEGMNVNALTGYTTSMDVAGVMESLTPLEEERNLPLVIDTYNTTVTQISFAVRSLDGSDLLENTTLSSWDTQGDQIQAVLPIQEYIQEGTEYGLTITLTTEEQGEIYYYTRIVQNESLKIGEMLNYIQAFHAATYSSADAQEYAVNWETDSSADNSTLAYTTVHSQFSQLTFGSLSPIQLCEAQMQILEVDESFGSFLVQYVIQYQGDDGETHTATAEEYFCLQWSSTRFYLMSYERTIRQDFLGDLVSFTGNTVEFGIVSESDVEVKASDSGTYQVFTIGGSLWSYAPSLGEATRIFSFHEESESLARRFQDDYAIQILSVDDQGNVDFLVYGYMSRGNHQGEVGLSFYQYDAQKESLQEVLFLSSDKSFEILAQGIETLSYRQDGLIYLLFDDTVYAVDCLSKEVLSVVEGATEHNLVVNEDQTAIAWQEGNDLQQADTLRILYLETGLSQTVSAQEGEYLQIEGFIGYDFVYTAGRVEEIQTEGFSTLYPRYALIIRNEEGVQEACYQYDSIYIGQVTVTSGQVHMEKLKKSGTTYVANGEDTLMLNETEISENTSVLMKKTEEKCQRVWYLAFSSSGKKTVHFVTPEQISYAETISGTRKSSSERIRQFYAYQAGSLEGIYSEAGEAILAVYDKMGWVTDSEGNRIWHRTAKAVSVHLDLPTVGGSSSGILACLQIIFAWEGAEVEVSSLLEQGMSPQEILEENLSGAVVNLSGCLLKQVYYYLTQGTPVIVLNESGEALLLSGYDAYNVEIYSPSTGTTYKMGQQDATDAFSAAGNCFLSYVR